MLNKKRWLDQRQITMIHAKTAPQDVWVAPQSHAVDKCKGDGSAHLARISVTLSSMVFIGALSLGVSLLSFLAYRFLELDECPSL